MFSRFLAPAAALLALTLGQGQAAEGDAARLEDALRLREVFSVMSEEGSDYGAQIEADMFPGAGGPSWVRR